ncbi:hypothetical protein PGTUg99_034578 [Puccinia graminis f. sp. tritici]|uniref:Uncharacterized protein n=1 Tax=Puccinia graminis f. sp. tritici TaxID=56615 RepID=A0A5B0SES8_PUCGR|nr:hypothetical protein PGTUg99_034578 [Puccinia graminis f. sp. tritici]
MVNSPPHPQQEKESGESQNAIAQLFQGLHLDYHHRDHSNQQTNPTASDHPQPPPEQHDPSPNRISYQRPPDQSTLTPQTAWPPSPSPSPIRMPLPTTLNALPSPPVYNHPKPIPFPIPQPTGIKNQALSPPPIPTKTHHSAGPAEAKNHHQPFGNHSTYTKPNSSKPLTSSNRINTTSHFKIHQHPSTPSHLNQTPITIDLTEADSPEPIKTNSNVSKPATPLKTPSKKPIIQPNQSNNSTPAFKTPIKNANKPTHQNLLLSNPSTPFRTPLKSNLNGLDSPSSVGNLSDSSPTTPGSPSTLRCAGVTQQGKPCSRKPMKRHDQDFDRLERILDNSSSAPDDPTSTTSTPTNNHLNPSSRVPRFCFQHYQKFISQSSSFRENSRLITYSEWIAKELPETVRIMLKMEMEKYPNPRDGDDSGYLYCHEMHPQPDKQREEEEEEGEEGTYIKVGRSIRPIARLGEWKKQCRSKDPILRGFFPESSSSSKTTTTSTTATTEDARVSETCCYLDGAQSIAPKGIRFHRKWERLTLVELTGWAQLHFPAHDPKSPCIDCAKVHVEIFFLKLGSYEKLVKPTILKWLHWCSTHYS